MIVLVGIVAVLMPRAWDSGGASRVPTNERTRGTPRRSDAQHDHGAARDGRVRPPERAEAVEAETGTTPLEVLIRALRDPAQLGAEHVALASELEGTPLPPAVAIQASLLAQARSREEWDEADMIADTLFSLVEPSAAVSALHSVVRPESPTGLDLRPLSGSLAERAAEADDTNLAELSLALMQHPESQWRAAGLTIAASADEDLPAPVIDRLREIAMVDEDQSLRWSTLSVLLSELTLDERSDGLRRDVLPLVRMAALRGPRDVREDALRYLPDFGELGIPVSLEVLRQGEIDVDTRTALVSWLVSADRVASVLEADASVQTLVSLSSVVLKAARMSIDVLPLAAHVDTIVRQGDDPAALRTLQALAVAGEFAAAERVAMDSTVRPTVRARALQVLLGNEFVPKQWGADARSRGKRVARGLTSDSSTSAELRLLVVSVLRRVGSKGDRALRTFAIETLGEVSLHDGDDDVRAKAVLALDSLRDTR